MSTKFNTYDMDNEDCPECNKKELVYVQSCNAVHCQECNTWFSLTKDTLENGEDL